MRHSVLLDSEIKGQARDQGPQPCLILSSSTQLLIPTASDLINFDQFRTFLPLLNSPRCLPHHSFALAQVRWNHHRKHLVELGTGRARAGLRSPCGWIDEGGGPRVASPVEALAQSFFLHCLLDEAWPNYRQRTFEGFRQKPLPEALKRTRSVPIDPKISRRLRQNLSHVREIFRLHARHRREAKKFHAD